MDNNYNGGYYNGFGTAGYGNTVFPQYNNLYGYNVYQPQQIKVPQNQNALTNEEIQTLENSKPSNKIDLTVDPTELLRAVCSHKKNGYDVVQRLNDETNQVYCPICGEKWTAEQLDQEQLEGMTNDFISQIQNAKWLGDLPIELTRQYCGIIPLIRKFPAIQKLAMSNFEKYYGQNQFQTGHDASIYAQYNSLFGPAVGYPQQTNIPGYYPAQQMAPNQQFAQQGYYNQPQAPVAPPTVNPMQAPMGYNPAAPNQQFAQQAAMMMPYGQPQQQVAMPQAQPQAAPATPNFGVPTYQPQAQQTTTTADGSTITNQGDAVKSEKSIKL